LRYINALDANARMIACISWRQAMPTLLPVRTGSKPTSVPKSERAPRRRDAQPSVEGLDIWALCVGLAACILAGFIYSTSGDQVGTAMVLVLAAVVVLAMWRAGSDPREI
jgi:hypothetical protein